MRNSVCPVRSSGVARVTSRTVCSTSSSVRSVASTRSHPVGSWRQELYRADAVPSNRREQIKRIGGARFEASTDAVADHGAVWQQIVEVILNGRSAHLAVRGQRQGQRECSAARRIGPRLLISKERRAATPERSPLPYPLAIHPDDQRCHCKLPLRRAGADWRF